VGLANPAQPGQVGHGQPTALPDRAQGLGVQAGGHVANASR
jgi:hypothetical protein